MSNPHWYPLTSFTSGGGVTVPIEGSSQAILFGLIDPAALPSAGDSEEGTSSIDSLLIDAPLNLDPSSGRRSESSHESGATPGRYSQLRFQLIPDPATGGFSVLHRSRKIGRVPVELRRQYPNIDQLLVLGLLPTVAADVSLQHGVGRVIGKLRFPAPSMAVPMNQPPQEPWALLPESANHTAESLHIIDTAAGNARDRLTATAGQWLATVNLVDERVVLSVGDQVLGPLSEESSEALSGIISHYQLLGLTVVARVYCYQEGEQIHTVTSALSTDRIPEDYLEPQVSPLPNAHPAQAPATGEFPAAPGGSKEWAVTMAEADVTESFPAVRTDLKPITSPTMGAVRAVQAPQEPESQPEPEPLSEREPEARTTSWAGLILLLIGLVAMCVAGFVSMPDISALALGAIGFLVAAAGLVMAIRRKR